MRANSQTLISSCTSAQIGQSSVCTVTVQGFNPTGNVSFTSSGGGSFNSTICTLSSGSCSVSYSQTSFATANIVASYSGDSNNNASSSAPYSFAPGKGASSVSVTCSQSSIAVGTGTTCTATVSGYSPTGTVQWSDGGAGGSFSSQNCLLSPLNSSASSCQVNYTPNVAGQVSLKASYSGDTNNLGNFGSYTLNVVTSASSVSVNCAPNPDPLGSGTSCTANVTGFHPKGTVSWTTDQSGSFSSTTCTLMGGKCSVTYTPSTTNTATITATYSGDTNNVGSSGNTLLSVGPVASQTTVSCTSVVIGSSSTCTASVSGFSPTGTVTFTSNDPSASFNPSNQCTLSPSGSCSVSYTPSVAGSVTITASYSGDLNNNPSSGNTNLNVQQTVPTVSVSCSPNPISSGQSTTCTVVVSGFNPTGTVSWQTTGLGSFMPNSCTLSPNGSCSVTYTSLSSSGSVDTITATYAGDSNNQQASGSTSVSIT
jgi:hypothetical protein